MSCPTRGPKDIDAEDERHSKVLQLYGFKKGGGVERGLACIRRAER